MKTRRAKKWTVDSGRWTASVRRSSVFPSTGRHPLSTDRRGTTLSEVLVSTLVMSIGVVALATLFPISVLRSIQASQLTNAANLRYNAEAQIRAIPELVNIGREWQAAANYSVGDAVTPSLEFRRSAPPSVHICTTAGITSGAEPIWNARDGATTNDGTVAWTTLTLRNYVIDPLAYMLVDSADADARFRRFGAGAALTGARQHFGNVNGNAFSERVNRFPAFGLYDPAASSAWNEFWAASASVLPDSWTLQTESLDLANLTATSIDLVGVNFNDLSQSVTVPSPDLVPDRIVLLDETGKRSKTLTITGLSGTATSTTINWGTSTTFSFTPVRARVESLERRYSYLLSVRRRFGGSAHVDCVIFFRRTYGVQDEQVYSCVFRKIDRGTDLQPGNAGVDDNNDGTDDNAPELGFPGSDDRPRNFVILQYSSTGLKPFFKKGGYICDAHNLRWYRIIDVEESSFASIPPHSIGSVTPPGFELDPVAPGMDRFVRLTLDQNIIEDSPFTTNTLTPATTTVGGVDTIGGAILIRGIVDVFPLRPRTF